MRKLFSLFLALVATASLWAYDFQSGDLCYNITSSSAPYTAEVTYQHYQSISNYSGLTTATIPSSVTYNGTIYSVTSIGNYAFYDCYSLTSVTIPNSVTSIGGAAFYNCESFTKTNYTGDIAGWCDIKFGGSYANPMYYSHNFYINDQEIKDLVIPNSVDSIHNYAFCRCSGLTSLTIPNSVTSIGASAFADCDSLTSMVVESGNTTYDSRDNCNAIIKTASNTLIAGCQNTIIPNSVTSIGSYAFYGCSSLTSITIPESVMSIGSYAFHGCSSLTSITCEAIWPPEIGAVGGRNGTFDYNHRYIPVYVPCGSKNEYEAARNWNDFTNIQEPQAEYAIQVYTSNSQMGTAKVDYNTYCEGNQISARANYGYHFVQWSDGNTDNPRTLMLTQDTTLTAEFAPNQYIITTVSADEEMGYTEGDTVANYLEYITLSAIANYGYHFTQWNDGNVENPRQVQVKGDAKYAATFDKNIYNISLQSNNGTIESVTHAAYLDNVTMMANADYGYHFAQWSDGVTDNPRTFVITQDTTFTAEFAQSFSGQCGDNLYWVYANDTLTITGTGAMYDERPWGLFANDITKVQLPYGITHIGNDAFSECLNLQEITIPATVTTIGYQSFAGCRNLRNINCYPLLPPYAVATSFANYNVNLNVPCDYLEDYQYDIVFGSFKYINCMSSDEVEDTEDVEIDAGTTDVTIIWPTKENAYTYTIVIKKNGQVVCTLVFDAFGRLLNISFAPGRNGNHPAQYAEAVANGGFRFTVTGLEEGTNYTYDITTTDESDNTLATHSGEFTTQSNTPTAIEHTNSLSSKTNCHKIIRDNQLIIIRDGKTYNVMGKEL